MNGTRPVGAVEAARPIVSIGDARQDLYQRLNQMAVGRALQAQVLSRMNDGSFMVKLLDTPVRMSLPPNTQTGDTLDLTFNGMQPRPTFLLRLPAVQTEAKLSDTARLIDNVLRATQKEGAPTSLVGKAPLLDSPAAPPTQIAVALKNTLSYSGLFYESHVQQWASGQRPLTELMREPQGKLSNPALVNAALRQHGENGQNSQNAPLHADTAADTLRTTPDTSQAKHAAPVLDAPLPHVTTGTHDDIRAEAPRAANGQTDDAGSEHAATENRQASASAPRQKDNVIGKEPGAEAQEPVQDKISVNLRVGDGFRANGVADAGPRSDAAGLSDAFAPSRTDSPASESARMISLQLDTLEQRRVAWQGELFPGQKMEWEVTEDTAHGGHDDADRSWQSVVRFELPALGAISAAIRLNGNHLQVQIRAASEETALILRTHGNELVSALGAAGSPVDLLTVKRDDMV
ncbi:flagellar hook-length control protein FliK [Herbaspirillum sp. GCM10030257]|uniref:flagellar hook-length control protein FliK n=1 Tax=Herbaspirillum sp. GCM10030257 TaxID=3273393 RepID=UPI00360D2D19